VREDIDPIFSKDFVDAKIATDHMFEGTEVINSLGGEGSGYPWLAILRPDGTVIIDSVHPERGNIGSPRAVWEVEYWSVMMRASVTRITEEEIQYMATTWAEDRG